MFQTRFGAVLAFASVMLLSHAATAAPLNLVQAFPDLSSFFIKVTYTASTSSLNAIGTATAFTGSFATDYHNTTATSFTSYPGVADTFRTGQLPEPASAVLAVVSCALCQSARRGRRHR